MRVLTRRKPSITLLLLALLAIAACELIPAWRWVSWGWGSPGENFVYDFGVLSISRYHSYVSYVSIHVRTSVVLTAILVAVGAIAIMCTCKEQGRGFEVVKKI